MKYASDRHAVLLIFQAMDAAGKDGAIRHVMCRGSIRRGLAHADAR
jgi:polyphosphate kinase 2 (PPK2 family)